MSDGTEVRAVTIVESDVTIEELEPSADEVEEAIELGLVEEAEDAEAAADEVAEEAAEEDEAEAVGRLQTELEAEVDLEGAPEVDTAMLDALMQRSGVLPPESEEGMLDEDAELPAPRRDDEFVCSSCFLVKLRSQMGDAERRLCRDCLNSPNNTRRVIA